jgi:Leucine-rich repeat (LRR) protein
LARQESIPAIEILIRCLNTNIFQNRSDIEKTKRILRSTPEGEKRYEADIRERAQLSAPGGERSKSFPSSTTDQEVREFLMSNRGGHLEDLNLSCTAISDCIFEVIVKLPALKTLNLMTTRITDEGLLTLSYAQKLKCLNLNECERITPTGLRYLTRLRNLTTLSINCTSLDDEVFEELRSSLPMLETVDHRYTNVLYR